MNLLPRYKSKNPVVKSLKYALLVSAFSTLSLGIPSAWAESGGVTITVENIAGSEAEAFKPYRSLSYTPEGIKQVREIAKTSPRGQALAQKFIESSNIWMSMTEEEILELLPGKDAVFAAGAVGDPKTGGRWPHAGRSDDVCSLDRPGTVRSPFTGDIYGNEKPGEKYYDDGTGWVSEEGKTYYFKGVWNSWIMTQMLNGIDDMAVTYMLTGDEQIAERALFMLDAISTLRGQRPHDKGMADWPGQVKEDDKGFFCYMGNGANFRIYQTVLSLDLLAASPAVQQLSPSGGKGTIFENIRDNYMRVYENFYKEQLRTFYNHTLVLYANEIAQGALFGNADYLKEGIEAVYGFMDNTLNRDGDYFENAAGYNDVGVNYAAQMMVPLINYNPERYDNSEVLPQRENYPFSLQFGNDPRWRSAAIFMQYRPIVLGRKVQYGDYYPDRSTARTEDNEWVSRRRAVYLRMLYQQTDRADWKNEFSALYWQIPQAFLEEPDTRYVKEFGMSQWFDLPKPQGDPEAILANLPVHDESDMIPGRVIGILRSGTGPNRRAAFMRGGVNASHGHDDKMAVILYGHGMTLTGHYGYRYAGTPDHFGWGTRAIAHKTVTVDQDLPPIVAFKYTPSSDVLAFVEKKEGLDSSAQIMEMSNPQEWRFVAKVNEYRRMLWLVDVSDEQFYFVDMFRIRGGNTHDYSWTGPFSNTKNPLVGFEIDGVDLAPHEHAWTLAGLDEKYTNETFDKEGQSWGERLDINTGYIKDLKIPGENLVNKMRWNPPPGNGYGFFWGIQTGQPEGDWLARWPLVDKKHKMEFRMLNTQGQTVVRGFTPTTTVDRSHVSLVTRRERKGGPLISRFVSVTQAGKENDWAIKNTRSLPLDDGFVDSNIIAVEAELVDGRRDVVISNSWTNPVKSNDLHFEGVRGFVRYSQDNEVEEMLLQEGTLLKAGGIKLEVAQKGWEGKVEAIDTNPEQNRIKVNAQLPAGAVLAGEGMLLTNPRGGEWKYSDNQYYEIQSVENTGNGSIVNFGAQSIIGGRLDITEVAEDGSLQTRWPNMIIGHRHTRYYAGRQIRLANDPEKTTRVSRFMTTRSVNVEQPELFKAGDKAEILMIQEGDEFFVPTQVRLKKTGEHEWTVQTNQDVRMTLNLKEAGDLVLIDGEGKEKVIHPMISGEIHFTLPLSELPGGTGKLVLRKGN